MCPFDKERDPAPRLALPGASGIRLHVFVIFGGCDNVEISKTSRKAPALKVFFLCRLFCSIRFQPMDADDVTPGKFSRRPPQVVLLYQFFIQSGNGAVSVFVSGRGRRVEAAGGREVAKLRVSEGCRAYEAFASPVGARVFSTKGRVQVLREVFGKIRGYARLVGYVFHVREAVGGLPAVDFVALALRDARTALPCGVIMARKTA